jgi:type IV pilus assembly protein PilX
MVALIVLVAMTLAGIALMRSVDTTTIIAGNLGFQQSAMHSGDIGTETAISWLVTNNTGTTLQANNTNTKYYEAAGLLSGNPDTATNESWDHYWTSHLDSSPASTPVSSAAASGLVWTLPTDPVTGNTVSYYIQRLCKASGPPSSPGAGCAVSQSAVVTSGSSKGASVVALQFAGQYYYRITTRITGPRNTVSYIQTIVAL